MRPRRSWSQRRPPPCNSWCWASRLSCWAGAFAAARTFASAAAVPPGRRGGGVCPCTPAPGGLREAAECLSDVRKAGEVCQLRAPRLVGTVDGRPQRTHGVHARIRKPGSRGQRGENGPCRGVLEGRGARHVVAQMHVLQTGLYLREQLLDAQPAVVSLRWLVGNR
jgi:hypothetical protein